LGEHFVMVIEPPVTDPLSFLQVGAVAAPAVPGRAAVIANEAGTANATTAVVARIKRRIMYPPCGFDRKRSDT
jgi:hypothetical protein